MKPTVGQCEDCAGTGWCGDNGPGVIGNSEVCRCDCGIREKCSVGAHRYVWVGDVPWCKTCNREADVEICRTHVLPDVPLTDNRQRPSTRSGGTVPALVLRLAELARRKHYYCEDTWYSCPKHPDGCANDGAGRNCTCGADQINAEVDAILAELTPNVPLERSAVADTLGGVVDNSGGGR